LKTIQSKFKYRLLRNKLNNRINFLDIIKAINADSLQFSFYTKPTTHKNINLKFHVIHQSKVFDYNVFRK